MNIQFPRLALFSLAIASILASTAEAGHVSGYTRKDGTYVAPYERSNRNGTVTDNYSYTGNVDPYTGSVGTNRYTHDLTSPYYDGTPDSSGRYGHAGSQY